MSARRASPNPAFPALVAFLAVNGVRADSAVGGAGSLDAHAFAAHVDSEFVFRPLHPDPAPVVLVLGAVELIGDGAAGQWFALTWLNADGTSLPPGTYEVSHDELGVLSIHVTAVGRLSDGRGVYEAIFDRREVAWSSPVARS